MNMFNDTNTAMRRDILAHLYMKNPTAFLKVLSATQNPTIGEVTTTASETINVAADSERT